MKEFQVKEFPKLFIIDHGGDVVRKQGIEDMMNCDVEKIQKMWKRNVNQNDDPDMR